MEEYRAIFPFPSDTEGDLVFTEGDTVLVYWAQDNGWWYGEVDSKQGWFPGSFVEVNKVTSARNRLYIYTLSSQCYFYSCYFYSCYS